MNLGLGELLVVILNLLLILAVPGVIIFGAVFILRRIRDLEARITELERDKGMEKSERGES
jgi:hypothetical protein